MVRIVSYVLFFIFVVQTVYADPSTTSRENAGAREISFTFDPTDPEGLYDFGSATHISCPSGQAFISQGDGSLTLHTSTTRSAVVVDQTLASLTPASPSVSFSSASGFFRIEKVGVATQKTRMVVKCFTIGAGVFSSPGMIGTAATVETARAIGTLDSMPLAMSTIPTTPYIVDPWLGDDDNPGSFTQPIQSWGQVAYLMRSFGSRIRVINERTFSPLTFFPIAGTGGCLKDETVSYDSGTPGTAVVVDLGSESGAIVFRTLTGPDPTTGDTVVGASSQCSLSLAGSQLDTISGVPLRAGTAGAGTTISSLIDLGADFVADGVQVNSCVKNTTADNFSFVQSVTPTVLTLTNFTVTPSFSPGDSYAVHRACAGELTEFSRDPALEKFDDRIVAMVESFTPGGPKPVLDANNGPFGS